MLRMERISVPLFQGNKRIFGPQNGQKEESSPFMSAMIWKVCRREFWDLPHEPCPDSGPQTGSRL